MGEVWVDHDYPAREHKPEKCGKCGDDLILRHVCTDHIVIPRAAVVDAIQWRDWQCHEDVTRKGQSQPCNKTAVAIRIDPEDGGPYPVCKVHTRGEMVSLADLLADLRPDL